MKALSPLSGQRSLVTGASGFIGSHLCRHLDAIGCVVHAVSRTRRPTRKNDHWQQIDLENTEAVRNLLQTVKPDIIFHLSGLVTAVTPLEFVLPTFRSLLTSTVNLLVAATEVGCRRIVLSASLTEPRPSDSETVPGSPYAAAKWASSVYGRMFHALYNAPTVIVRPYMTYGPGQNEKKLIPSVTLSLLRGQRPRISSGQWRADWIYIDDVIEGYLAAAHIPKIEGSTLDLGTGKLVSVSSVVQQLVQLVAPDIKPIFGVVPDRPLERVCAADLATSLSVLGWKPSVCLEAGLKQTIDWYKTQTAINLL